jgi:ribosome-associated translation inhibitor RaiA
MLQAQDVHVVVRGEVGERQRRHAQERVARVTRHVRAPILFARVTLAAPAGHGPVSARAVLDLDGRPVRATASAADMPEAIEQIHEGLRHQLEHLTDRRKRDRRRGVPIAAGAPRRL